MTVDVDSATRFWYHDFMGSFIRPSRAVTSPRFSGKPVSKIFLLFFLTLITTQTDHVLAQGRPPTKVVVSPVILESIHDQVQLIGTVESWRTSRVAAETSGKVAVLKGRRGDRVEKGAVLARLGKSALQLKLRETIARRNASRARLKKAVDQMKRSEKLVKEALLSERAYREAELTVDELREGLAVSEAAILQIRDELEKKTVRAPFDGVVTRELTEVGQWVQKGGGILRMVDLSTVRILVDIPERYVSGVKKGSAVRVRIDALGKETFPGKVHALVPEGDRASRLFPLEIRVKNAQFRIKEGMLARVEFDLGEARRSLMVDKDAIIVRGPQTYLFSIQEGKAIRQKVSTGKAKGTRIEIKGPIEEGQLVVIRGNERLRDGQAVEVLPSK
ncbi:MAG TPA: efflux RND transporter periplasmic adaptor subunit [Nitrospiria bacterium]|nr:efflux RND transporter periplasmic adaptor subunit [Candidatus Manganitrophaceae bacterium]HIL34810.1 efflux RND transporter periplasmic adaptor subunit [Candidatus Manganitrophaceae bacterium]